MTIATRYVFDPAWERERDRLEALGSVYNAGTYRHLADLGVAPGWRVLELGGGTGTVAAWLCDRVAPGGRVVATDLDTRFLDAIEHDHLEVRRHDVVRDPLDDAAYDLIHARLLLEHVPEREAVLVRLVDALKPGGWLLVEDFDFITWGVFDPPSELQARVAEAIARLFAAVGFDATFSRRLPRLMRQAGLAEVGNEAHLRLGTTGTPEIEGLPLMLEQMGPRLVDAGLMGDADVAAAIAEARDAGSGRVGYPPLMVSAWGRRPV
ncbi:MAG TPA: methyltransferase [Candidatus Dormibacteraeota bacterium]|jgi:SAM-dependent methyltransferase|nr:methyltransferase [Candidatus Dormibacteraeota bacterium]